METIKTITLEDGTIVKAVGYRKGSEFIGEYKNGSCSYSITVKLDPNHFYDFKHLVLVELLKYPDFKYDLKLHENIEAFFIHGLDVKCTTVALLGYS